MKLTKQQRTALASLDKTSKSITTSSRNIDIIGVLVGIKPATFFYVDTPEEVTRLEPLVRSLGLVYLSLDIPGTFVVSRTKQTGAEFYKAYHQRDKAGKFTTKAHKEIGQLLGYPKTSTEYFLKRLKSMFTDAELPMVFSRSTEGTVSEYFCQFVMSPEYYQNELEVYQKPLEAATKELLPNTYTYLTKRSRKDRLRNAVKRALRFFRKPAQEVIKRLYVD